MKTDENGLSYCIRFLWNQLLCRSLGRSDCAPISLFYKRSEQISYWSSLYPTFVSAWRDKILNLLCLILLLQIRLQKQLQRTSQWKTYQVRLSISRVFSREFSLISKVWEKTGHVQKLASNKNPQFLSNPYETWWKWLPHEVIIFTKFHKDWTKIVDFLLMANFWTCEVFSCSDFRLNHHFRMNKSNTWNQRLKWFIYLRPSFGHQGVLLQFSYQMMSDQPRVSRSNDAF